MSPSLRPGWDVLVVARTGIVTADRAALTDALERVLCRDGVLAPAPRDPGPERPVGEAS